MSGSSTFDVTFKGMPQCRSVAQGVAARAPLHTGPRNWFALQRKNILRATYTTPRTTAVSATQAAVLIGVTRLEMASSHAAMQSACAPEPELRRARSGRVLPQNGTPSCSGI